MLVQPALFQYLLCRPAFLNWMLNVPERIGKLTRKWICRLRSGLELSRPLEPVLSGLRGSAWCLPDRSLMRLVLESPDSGVARLRIARNSGHEIGKRCRGASSSLSSWSGTEWLACTYGTRAACSEFGTVNIASSILHQACYHTN